MSRKVLRANHHYEDFLKYLDKSPLLVPYELYGTVRRICIFIAGLKRVKVKAGLFAGNLCGENQSER